MTVNTNSVPGFKGPRNLEDLRAERLEAALGELDRDLEYRASSLPSEPSDGAKKTLEIARGAAEKARKAFEAGNEGISWSHCHAARRFVLQILPAKERELRRDVLRREAAEKLSNWRRDAVSDILGGNSDIAPENLALAQYLLDQHFENVYFKLNAAATRFKLLRVVLVPAVALLFIVSFFLEPQGSDSFLNHPPRLGTVLMLGALGAWLSYALSRTGVGGRIPDFLEAYAAPLVRPFIGALSAVFVCLVVQSDLLPLQGDDTPALYAWAVAAGFSDQLVSMVMRQVEEAAVK